MIHDKHVYFAPALENCREDTSGLTEYCGQCMTYLGHRLGALGDGVLGELTGEDETNRCLDLTRGDCRLLRVRREL